MRERVVEVSSEFYKQLTELLQGDEQVMVPEYAETHGAHLLLLIPSHGTKALVITKRKIQGVQS